MTFEYTVLYVFVLYLPTWLRIAVVLISQSYRGLSYPSFASGGSYIRSRPGTIIESSPVWGTACLAELIYDLINGQLL